MTQFPQQSQRTYRPNRSALWVNNKKNPNQPDYKGNVEISYGLLQEMLAAFNAGQYQQDSGGQPCVKLDFALYAQQGGTSQGGKQKPILSGYLSSVEDSIQSAAARQQYAQQQAQQAPPQQYAQQAQPLPPQPPQQYAQPPQQYAQQPPQGYVEPVQHQPVQHQPVQHQPVQHQPVQHQPVQHQQFPQGYAQAQPLPVHLGQHHTPPTPDLMPPPVVPPAPIPGAIHGQHPQLPGDF